MARLAFEFLDFIKFLTPEMKDLCAQNEEIVIHIFRSTQWRNWEENRKSFPPHLKRNKCFTAREKLHSFHRFSSARSCFSLFIFKFFFWKPFVISFWVNPEGTGSTFESLFTHISISFGNKDFLRDFLHYCSSASQIFHDFPGVISSRRKVRVWCCFKDWQIRCY